MSLRPSSRFAGIYRTGRRTTRGAVTVIETEGIKDVPEVGVVAGKRVGNAVRRNRAKRRLRAAASMAPLRPGRAYVIVAGPDVVDAPFASLRSWVDEAVARTPS